MTTLHVRTINPKSEEEILLVAERMRLTLCEVLGEKRGRDMYSMEWLIERVLWHLDSEKVTGQVFLVVNEEGEIVGQTIVRIELDGAGHEIALFSTTYVEPGFRRFGAATVLLKQGERWMREHKIPEAVTYTDEDNLKLQNLYLNEGYVMMPMPDQFVKLAKPLSELGKE